MANAPYGVRLLVGAAATVVEETRKLPQTLLMYPVTLVSQAAHLVMRFQQNIADLVIKGDETLQTLFPPKDEQPEWATFDEDLADKQIDSGAEKTTGGNRRTEGRFALYTNPAEPSASARKNETRATSVELPDIAVELDYEALTLAQLRARLQSLTVAELDSLLAYERAAKGRAPFETLLANRITRATAK